MGASAHQKFYLILYTQTDAHMNRYICGSGLDLGLNEAGIEEARKLSHRFKRNPLKIKKMIAGPELRCIQMADFLHDEMKARLVLSRDFADQFMGDYEGKPIEAKMDFKNPPSGESDIAFTLRVQQGYAKLLLEKEVCLVVTHYRVAKKIFEKIGLGSENLDAGTLYAIEIPPGEGIAQYHQV
jgi:broad specificity phosphatase PhoE